MKMAYFLIAVGLVCLIAGIQNIIIAIKMKSDPTLFIHVSGVRP